MTQRNDPPGQPFGPDYQLRAVIARNGYGNTVTQSVERLLRDTYNSITSELYSSGVLSDARRNALERFSVFAKERLQELAISAHDTARTAIAAAGTAEHAGALANGFTLNASMGLPSRAQIIAIARYEDVIDRIALGGVGFSEWWTDTSVSALKRMRALVQQEFIQGTNPRDVARQLYNSDPRSRTIGGMQLNQWRTAIRSAMTAVQAQASLTSFKELGVTHVLFEAVLDARTSVICRAIDAKHESYALDDPKLPVPPLHPNCRSGLVPDVGKESDVKPSARITQEEWLRSQPKVVQDATLGTGIADLWREGKVTLPELINADRRPLTLKQLQQYLLTRPNAVNIITPEIAKLVQTIENAAADTIEAAAVESVAFIDKYANADVARDAILAKGAKVTNLTARLEQRITELNEKVKTSQATFEDLLSGKHFDDWEWKRGLFADPDFRERYTERSGGTERRPDVSESFNRAAFIRDKVMGDPEYKKVQLYKEQMRIAQRRQDKIKGSARDAIHEMLELPDDHRLPMPKLETVKKGDRALQLVRGLTAGTAKTRDYAQEGMDFIQRMLARNTASLTTRVNIGNTRSRAFAVSSIDVIAFAASDLANVRVAVHEIGHLLENRFSWGVNSVAWRTQNAVSGSVRRLSAITGFNYGPREVAVVGKPGVFQAAYIGKVYPTGDTEVLSVGLELFFHDPLGFARDYPDHFRFIWSFLRDLTT